MSIDFSVETQVRRVGHQDNVASTFYTVLRFIKPLRSHHRLLDTDLKCGRCNQRRLTAGASPTFPFKREATGAEAPFHNSTIDKFIKIELEQIYCSYSRIHKIQNGFL